jgi:hypothetical protein
VQQAIQHQQSEFVIVRGRRHKFERVSRPIAHHTATSRKPPALPNATEPNSTNCYSATTSIRSLLAPKPKRGRSGNVADCDIGIHAKQSTRIPVQAVVA